MGSIVGNMAIRRTHPPSGLHFSLNQTMDLVNHVVLPPRLPQEEDKNAAAIENDMLDLAREVARAYIQTTDEATQVAWEPVLDMLSDWIAIKQDSDLRDDKLRARLSDMQPTSCLAIHLAAQNAGIMIIREDSRTVAFECFEASPTSDSVMSTQGRLLRTFPGCRVTCQADYLSNDYFCKELAVNIRRLNNEAIGLCTASTSKAGSKVTEERDTTNPALVVDYLMNMLSTLGQTEDFVAIQKRTRDDVLWKNSRLPWRRSPFWLVLKIAIQRLLRTSLKQAVAQREYKTFMIHMVAQVLDSAVAMDVTGELIVPTHAKLAQRIHKLEQEFGESPIPRIIKLSRKAEQAVAAMWLQTQEGTQRSIKRLPLDGWADAACLSLPRARRYLTDALHQLPIKSASAPFVPQSQARIFQGPEQLPYVGSQATPPIGDRVVQLADVEMWAESHLATWTQDTLREPSCWPKACDELVVLVRNYWAIASTAYNLSPLEKSGALLVLFELWVALDRICVASLPLLGRYSPEIPPALLEPLLLPKVKQLNRLLVIETYIRSRHDSTTTQLPGIFEDIQTRSFSNQYYDFSPKQKDLCARIVRDDAVKKAKKVAELERMIKEYNNLINRADKLDCDRFVNRRGYDVHDRNCAKCALNKKAKNMRIAVDEKSLPEDVVQFKAAVFELVVPVEFAAWRDTTWYLLHDVSQRKMKRTSPKHVTLQDYSQLTKYVGRRTRQPRITLASSTKSFTVAHYKDTGFPTSEKNICVNNGLKYATWSGDQGTWVSDSVMPSTIKSHCIMKLPPGTYSNLGWASVSSSHTANSVMARQSDCHQDLEMREFVAYGSLRAGERLQWLNILRELGCSNLDHNAPAVNALFQQAAYEAGSFSGEPLRHAHAEFDDVSFCRKLLSMLERLVAAIELSWNEQYAMATAIQLASRLLSLTSRPEVTRGCLELMRKARSVAFGWCRYLKDTHLTATESEEALQHNANILLLGAALLCFSTFDTEDVYIENALNSADDLAIVAEVHTIIHDHLPRDSKSLPDDIQRGLLRRTKVACAIESRFRALAMHNGGGLNKAVEALWNGAVLQADWNVTKEQDSQWLSNTTVTEDSVAQTVHYNLITGALLVDGRPLGKVPDEYKRQQIFQTLFGPAVLDVYASDMPGMLYRVSRYLHGNQVHIGFKDKQVIVKARHGDRVIQAIPPDAFQGDFPAYFINSFVHWLDEKTGEIEFRPKVSLWLASDENWKLRFSSMDLLSAKAAMCLRHRSLVDHTSSLGKAIARILGVLDNVSYIHITVTNDEYHVLEVDLHRYNLHFVVTSTGELKSVEYNAVVDLDQSVGTLIGLQNKLVLRDEAVTTLGINERSVLVPYSDVVPQKTGRHVQVKILPEHGLKQQYFVYKLDRVLHKLRGPGDNLSSLHKAYLHAVTSYTLPDPFTQHTGTEEALETLHEASTFSGCPLNDEAIRTLNAIAGLTPSRNFYPKHLTSMQTVVWNESLSPLSQHDDFYPAAKAIVEHANQFSAFYSGPSDHKELDICGEQTLLDRARKQNTSRGQQRQEHFYSATSDDRIYSARDRLKHDERSQNIYRIAKLIKRWQSDSRPASGSLLTLLQDWKSVSGYHENFKVASFEELTSLKFSAHWGSLYELCRSANRQRSTFQLMFLFCAVAFGTKLTETDVRIQSLLGFVFSSVFQDLNPPAVHASYTLGTGSMPKGETIRTTIEAQTTIEWVSESDPPNEVAPEARLAYISNKEQELKSEIDALHAHVMSEWPSQTISIPESTHRFINKALAIRHCQVHFNEWHKNRRFIAHITAVQNKLSTVLITSLDTRLPPLLSSMIPKSQYFAPITKLSELLQDASRARTVRRLGSPKPLTTQTLFAVNHPKDFSELEELVLGLRSSASVRRSRYGEALDASLEALKNQNSESNHEPLMTTKESIGSHYASLRLHKRLLLVEIQAALAPRSVAQSVLNAAGLWPRATARSLMMQLCPSNIGHLHEDWKIILLALCELTAQLQRCKRLRKAADASDMRTAFKELETPGRQGWSATQYPGWLLLEIENNITIRPQQAKVALEMMKPISKSNSVLQLNMGEGKSSVITPMVVVALADTTQLVRVIVLKPLLRQTEQLLSQRLGGLLNQKVYHIPFSRKTELDGKVVGNLASLLQQCEAQRGVLLALPEHILSFRLMGREKMSSDRQLAASLLGTERWQQQHCRDILDESDEILDAHFQLVYTVGSQKMLDGQPDRWLVAQALLARVNFHADQLGERYPDQLEITRDETSPNAFPTMGFLRNDVGEYLTALLVEDVMEGHLMGFSFDVYTKKARSAIKNFIRDRSVDEADVATVTRNCAAGQHHKVILVLRGLIAHGILLFALQRKRWLVDYGLDPSRCLMAVPYRAKGVPSLSSEYGHPDVAILLTSLSYYHTGLTYIQVRQCLAIVLKDSNAEDVYARWIAASLDVPANMMSLEAINLDDEVLCTEILFPMLHRNMEVANFYLSKVVFPKEGKEFAKKISASSWDIPSSQASKKLTTGFSGTNDTRFLLPFSIRQGDMPDLQHTNAMVLDLILREENKSYVYAATADAKKLDVTGLLSSVSRLSPAVTVLIDVGAQVLEKANLEVVQEWLDLVTSAKAAIYFDDGDEAMVLDRNGIICPLRISAFRARLQNCLIYLDEVHTRGIDLQIPTGARAAVTLGPRLVKDRLVQACMRMRKLGKDGHSLCFLSPPEVHYSIRDHKNDSSSEITSKDVLAWCMEQTCLSLDTTQPLRIMQGLEYYRRQKIWDTCLPANLSPDALVNDETRMARFWKGIQEPESQTLDHMYGVHTFRATTFARLLDRNSTDPMMQHLVQEFGAMNKLAMEDSSMDNEQEREVAHEIERERQVERPGQVKPLKPSISDGLINFIDTGSLDVRKGTNVFFAFEVFMESSAEVHSQRQQIDPESFSLFVTEDFKRSVDLSPNSNLDEYLRPVNWVLTSLVDGTVLIISPHEANMLLPRIKASEVVRLHTFSPTINKKMVAFDDLEFYTPSSEPGDFKPSADAIRDLNLFAGSLYLDNIAEYNALCHFLGVVTPSRRPADTEVGSDGFANPSIRQEIGWPEDCPFDQTPLSFLRQVFSLRMHGQDYSHTHMGFLVAGNAVRESAFKRVV